VEVLPLKGHKLKLKPKPLSKTKRAVLEHREVLFKRMLEEKGLLYKCCFSFCVFALTENVC